MQIAANQLKNSLQRKLAPIYLVSGDEHLLVDETCQSIRAAAIKAGYLERQVYYVESTFDWNQLLESASTYSLFADKKLIELRLASEKLNDKGKALCRYCESLPEDILLLIVSPKIDQPTKRTKWYTAIDQAGVSVPIWPIDSKQLPRWINQRLATHNIQADADAIQALAERVEGNLLAAAQEIEKLGLFYHSQTLDAETVAAAVSDHARYNVFYLVDKALAGEVAAALRAINGLRSESAEPTLVLWALARELRTLYEIKQRLNENHSLDFLLNKQRIWDKRKPLVKAALNRLSLAELGNLIQLCSQIDRAIKGLGFQSPWQQLASLVCTLGGQKLAEGTIK